jgi:hypothetical protein
MFSLVSRLTSQCIVTFSTYGSEPECSNYAIKNMLSRAGIKIPFGQEEYFKGKTVIYLEDPLFQEAFIKHWKYNFDPSLYFLQLTPVPNKPS